MQFVEIYAGVLRICSLCLPSILHILQMVAYYHFQELDTLLFCIKKVFNYQILLKAEEYSWISYILCKDNFHKLG